MSRGVGLNVVLCNTHIATTEQWACEWASSKTAQRSLQHSKAALVHGCAYVFGKWQPLQNADNENFTSNCVLNSYHRPSVMHTNSDKI